MDEQTIVYVAICSVFVLLLLVVSSAMGGLVGPIALVISIATLIGVMGMAFADFVLFPAITSMLKVSFRPAKGYKIVPKQDAIVKNVGGLFYATGYMTASLFAYTFKEEQVQDDQEQMMNAADKWERAVVAVDFPFKFHVLSAGRDVQKVREEVEGKRSYQEFQLNRAEQAGRIRHGDNRDQQEDQRDTGEP